MRSKLPNALQYRYLHFYWFSQMQAEVDGGLFKLSRIT